MRQTSWKPCRVNHRNWSYAESQASGGQRSAATAFSAAGALAARLRRPFPAQIRGIATPSVGITLLRERYRARRKPFTAPAAQDKLVWSIAYDIRQEPAHAV